MWQFHISPGQVIMSARDGCPCSALMQLACPGLSAAFATDATILTPNRLLSSIANEQFIQAQLAAGLETWPAPQIYSLNAWLATCWQETRYAGRKIPALLSPAQERDVWQGLVESEHPALFDHQQAASTAVAATRMLAEWHIPSEGEVWSGASDTRHFQRLYSLFRERAARENWITRSDLWSMATDWREGKPIALAGFATFSPATRRLAEASTIPVHYKAREKRAPSYAAQSIAEELEWTARWARHQFESNPNLSIGILVADLFTHKHRVAKTFREVFYSSTLHLPIETSVFHLHVAEPLSQHPLIASALLFLQLALPRIAIASAGAILRSPFLAGAAAEQSERALADLQLRRHRDLDVTLNDIERATVLSPTLRKTWTAIRRLLQSAPQYQELPAWSEMIGQLLSSTGWPGKRELTLHESEIVEDWKASLTELAALGFNGTAVSFPTALQRLESILEARSMETGDLASPIQILDASQSFGLVFDRAAIVNLSQDVWPMPVRPSPFIPLPLQRPYLKAKMDSRQRATEALFRSAPKVIAIHSRPLAPSAGAFTEPAKRQLRVWSGSTPGTAPLPIILEEPLDDSTAPPFTSNAPTAPGGVSILKSQSQCPFQAFAKYRLGANRPEDACFGFDARDRGTFLHRALEQVWLRLKTRDHLRATSLDDRRALVRQAVDIAVGDQSDSPFHFLAGVAERERLENVILEWLTMEEAREQPFTVEHIEKDQVISIAGLALSLRLDRVDRLSNNALVLIDYKSGEPKIKSLESDRPTEPQLLIYAAAMDEPVEGLFFAQMKPRKLRAIGYSRLQHFSKKQNLQAKVAKDWEGFLQKATTSVESIAREFVSGWASVDPQPGACTYCNLKPFCRVNAAGNSGEDNDDAD